MSLDPLSSGATWAHDLIFAQLLPIVAALAIAFVGLRMLGGRLDARRGALIVVGVFVAVGAPLIAKGLMPEGGDLTISAAMQTPQLDRINPVENADEVKEQRSAYSRASVR